MSINSTKYGVHNRLASLENFATEIRKEVSAIQLKEGKPGPRGCDGARGLTGAPGRDGADGRDGANAVGVKGDTGSQGARGEQGRKGERGEKGERGARGEKGDTVVGPKGERGPAGDCTLVGDAELQAALVKLRAQKARAQGAFLLAVQENARRPHSGLKRVLDAVLAGLKRDSGGYLG